MSNCCVSVLCVMVLVVIVTSNELINGTTTLESPTTESDRMEIIKTPSDRTETDTIASAEPVVTTTVYIDSSDDSGVCQIYRGMICNHYIGNKSVFIPALQTQKMLEEKLANAFTVIAHSQDLSASCEAFAKPSLCYSAFPLCHEDDFEGEQGPRKICREDCEILENEMCSTEYAIAKRHPLIGKQLVLHECDELPPIGSKESKGCLKLGIPRPENVDSSHTCYRDKGQTYRGTVSVTATGYLCTPWSQQLIHKPSDHPELVGGHSFCRNPGNTENQPWCFTVQNNHLKKELCDIPECVHENISKWRTVTNNYVRSLKSQGERERSGSATKKLVKYTYEVLLPFLKKNPGPRVNESSLRGPSTSATSSEPEVRPSATQRPSVEIHPSPTKTLENAFVECMKYSIEKRKSEEEDDNLSFFKSLLSDVKDLTSREKFKFRMGVLQLIQEIKSSRE